MLNVKTYDLPFSNLTNCIPVCPTKIFFFARLPCPAIFMSTGFLSSLPNLIPRLGIGKWHAQLEQLGKGAAKVLEKQVLVLAVGLDPLFKLRV
jgi:hypothetical protein